MSVADEPLRQAEGEPIQGQSPTIPRHARGKRYMAKLTAHCNQPWAAVSAFQQMREQAQLCGLDSLGHAYITVTIEVDGFATPEQIAELEARLYMLDLGEVKVIGERESTRG